MRKTLISIAVALFASTGLAQANTISGSIWTFPNDTIPGNAIPGNVPGTPADVTFSAPSDPLSFDSRNGGNDSAFYTLGTFLATGGAFNINYNNGVTSANSIDDTLWQIAGNVTMT